MNTAELEEKAWNNLFNVVLRPAHANAKRVALGLREAGVTCRGLITPATVIIGATQWRAELDSLGSGFVNEVRRYGKYTYNMDDAFVAALIAHMDKLDRDDVISMVSDHEKFWQILQYRIHRKYDTKTARGIVENDLDPAMIASLGV